MISVNDSFNSVDQPQVTVFNDPTHWSDLIGTLCVVTAVLGEWHPTVM